MRANVRSTALLLVIAAAGPALAQEQTTYAVTPFIGLYLPTADLVGNQTVPEAGLLDPETMSMSQETALAFGLRASRSLSSKLWVELEFQYAASAIQRTATRREPLPEPTITLDARVFTLGANVLWEVFRAPFTPFAFHLLGGLALVSRGGEFFDESADLGGELFEGLDGGTDIALIVGGGLRYGLSPHLGVRIDVRDYASFYAQPLGGADFESELQNDLWVTGGIELTL
jgi:hypothetical protein